MLTASIFAARLRGAMVGAVSGAAALPTHGLGGGMLPSSSAMMMLVSGCIVMGVLCAQRIRAGLPLLVGQLAVGQAVGHLSLTGATLEHQHGPFLTPTMLSCHLAVALASGVALWLAEHLVRIVVASVSRWLSTFFTPVLHAPAVLCPCSSLIVGTRHLLLSSGTGTRGPPAIALAV